MNKITLYTTDCPRCKKVEAILQNKGIEYNTNNNTSTMREKGIVLVPAIEIDGLLYGANSFREIVEKIQTL